jgi:hypothetical protein
MNASPKIQNELPILESAAILPTQSLDPSETGPKLRVDEDMARVFPPMVNATVGRLAEQGKV